MIKNFLEIQALLKDGSFQIRNKRMREKLGEYSLINISSQLDYNQNLPIYNNFKESSFFVIDELTKMSQNEEEKIYTIIFQKTIFIISNSCLSFLNDLFSTKKTLNACFLSKEAASIKQYLVINFNEIQINQEIKEYILIVKDELSFSGIKGCQEPKDIKQIKLIWGINKIGISTFLMKQSYDQLKENRIKRFFAQKQKKFQNEKINEDEIIKLALTGIGSSFQVTLIYHIEKEKLFAMKQPSSTNFENDVLTKREYNNYTQIKHPLLPFFVGVLQPENYNIIEFIRGLNMYHISKAKLIFDEKVTIIFELMIIIEFINRHNLVFRDLKPSNIIIDTNKTAVLIDFDRMVKIDDHCFTADFSSVFVDPEINEGNISYANDIYSLGILIYYIITEKIPKNIKEIESDEFSKYPEIQQICKNCIKKLNERPSIYQLIVDFYMKYHSQININDFFEVGENIYLDKCISETQFDIGELYYNKKEFDKAIHFYKLSASLNNEQAQMKLGNIYFEGKKVEQDIMKSISYFEQAANHGNSDALINLYCIYSNKCDNDKAFYFLL